MDDKLRYRVMADNDLMQIYNGEEVGSLGLRLSPDTATLFAAAPEMRARIAALEAELAEAREALAAARRKSAENFVGWCEGPVGGEQIQNADTLPEAFAMWKRSIAAAEKERDEAREKVEAVRNAIESWDIAEASEQAQTIQCQGNENLRERLRKVLGEEG